MILRVNNTEFHWLATSQNLEVVTSHDYVAIGHAVMHKLFKDLRKRIAAHSAHKCTNTSHYLTMPDIFVQSFSHLKNKYDADKALQILKRIASLVKPIMRKRNWVLPVLAEFFPDNPNLLGTCPSSQSQANYSLTLNQIFGQDLVGVTNLYQGRSSWCLRCKYGRGDICTLAPWLCAWFIPSWRKYSGNCVTRGMLSNQLNRNWI